jgi:outer membrane protein TolC
VISRSFVFSSLLASRQFTAANFAIDALNHPESTGFFRSSIGAEQLIFDGGRQRSAVESARLRGDMSTLTVDEAAASLASAATETYGRILIAEAGARAAHAALQSAQEDLARAERRRDAGMATDADVLALDAQVTALRQREIDSEADAAVAKAEMNRLTGSRDRAKLPGVRTAGRCGPLSDAVECGPRRSRRESPRAQTRRHGDQAGRRRTKERAHERDSASGGAGRVRF